MRRQIIGAAGALAIIMAAACAPPSHERVRPPDCDAGPATIFTVVVPLTRDQAEYSGPYVQGKLCVPQPPERLDVLVPPVQPGSGAASQVEQINAMGGVPIQPYPGDPTGYMRGRTVSWDLVPVVG